MAEQARHDTAVPIAAARTLTAKVAEAINRPSAAAAAAAACAETRSPLEEADVELLN